MKPLFLLLSLLSISKTYGQSINERKNEAGLFYEASFLGNSDQTQTHYMGVQLRRVLTDKFGYRIAIGQGDMWKDNHGNTEFGNGDTVLRSGFHNTIHPKMAVISIGPSFRQKLYKSIAMSYGADIRSGFAVGRKTLHRSSYTDSFTLNAMQSFGLSYTETKDPASMFYIGLTPYCGVSVKIGSIKTGIEASGSFVTTSVFAPSYKENQSSFSGANLRLFVNCTF